jgi:hypothetical protein
MDIKPLFGLGGVLIAAMTSEHPLHSPTSALRSGSATIPEPGSKVWTYRPSSPAWRSALATDDLHFKALDACDRTVRSVEHADPVQSEHRGDLCSAANPGTRGPGKMWGEKANTTNLRIVHPIPFYIGGLPAYNWLAASILLVSLVLGSSRLQVTKCPRSRPKRLSAIEKSPAVGVTYPLLR